ncbi:MAG: hypothetical protein AB7Y46_13760 [Armatimonadota bacterium]
MRLCTQRVHLDRPGLRHKRALGAYQFAPDLRGLGHPDATEAGVLVNGIDEVVGEIVGIEDRVEAVEIASPPRLTGNLIDALAEGLAVEVAVVGKLVRLGRRLNAEVGADGVDDLCDVRLVAHPSAANCRKCFLRRWRDQV